MKRLMTTLIFVLLGWTGLCLADGVTVQGTITYNLSGSFRLEEKCNIFLLDNDGTVQYSGSVTELTKKDELNTDVYYSTYSITNVVPGTYTLRFEGTEGMRIVIHEEENITVTSEELQKDFSLENSEVKNGTHGGVQLTIVRKDNTTAVPGATVTCTAKTEGAKPIPVISNAEGKVNFFLASGDYDFSVKAAAYKDTSFVFNEVSVGTFTDGFNVPIYDAPIEAVTLSGNITMVPAGDFPTDFQIQLTDLRHQTSQTTPTNNQYSFTNVPVGQVTLDVYDPTATDMFGWTDEYTVTTPARGMFNITDESATFTQDITITKVYARVNGTIKDVATLGSTLPTITLTKEGQTSYSYSAQATEGGKFTIKKVLAGTYTVGTTLAGYAVKNAPKVTIEDNLADFTLQNPLEFEEADMEITFKAMLGVGSGNNYIPFNGAVVKLFAKGDDVATATPLATATADAMGQFTLKTTGKLGTEYILYVTHEKIKPCSLAVTATKATMTGEDLKFTFELAPVAIPTPTFTPNRGNVKPGATIAFTLPESLDIETTYNDMAFILYVENNATVELKSDVATLWNAIAGGTGGEPMAEGAEGDETEPSATLPFKVGMYREGEWAIPVSLSADASGAVVLRAVLAVSEDMETLLYSNEMTATYTVEGEAVKPTAPTFYVDGEAVEAAAAEIAADAVVTLQNGYEEDEAEARLNPIYYKLNGTDADFEISDATVLTAEGFDALTIYNAGSEIAIDEDMTIKAATAHIDAIAKTVTWSDITTVAFTVTGGDTDPELPETVAKPTFSVAAGPVDKGTKLTWTWDEAYDEYPMVGVVYVANGKDEDLNITADDFEALYEEIVEIEEGSAREDGKVYLYMSEEEGICTITKDMTVKARLAVLVYDETNEEVEIKMALSPVETVAYTIKGGTTEPEKDTVATPTFNPAAGKVAKGTKVTVACATDSVKIYYTVDGSEPTAASTEYTAAIEINEALTIKAIAIKGETKSAVASAAYTIKEVANEELALAGVSVYPNPSDGEFQLDLPVAATVEVFASTGVLRQRMEAGAGIVTLNIDRSGIYFLRITADGRTTVKRVVVR